MNPARQNRTDTAYEHLLREVLQGRWTPGETVSTYTLADEMRISRTPIMEALKRLEGEGLVEIIPQVGWQVTQPSPAALEELFALRGAVEGLAAAAAAERIGAEELSWLENLLQQMEVAADARDAASRDELNFQFHTRVVAAGRMPRLAHTARGVWAALRHQLVRLPLGAERWEESTPEHREIFEALRRRAPKRARAAAERHAALSSARVIAAMDDNVQGFSHRALIYRGGEDFLAGSMPFVVEGLEASERVLVVTTEQNRELLARDLGARAEEVEFRDSAEWYYSPAHTQLAYDRYLEHSDRDRVRIVGEPVWDGISSAAIQEWTRYESIINVTFALSPVSFLCPYDAAALPDAVVSDARRTHPELCSGDEVEKSPDFTAVRPLNVELDRAELDEPTAQVAECPVDEDLRGVREFALEQADRAGVNRRRREDALLAVQEVASNVVVHGAGTGTLRTWVENGDLVYEIRDRGPGIADPLVGRFIPEPPLLAEPQGLMLARLLCDLVEVRSQEEGVAVRLHIGLD
jgi:DNA-binding GntR family transcriptional regulator/anti-sigma regulatory factor (Ser/Thr protein kinase)